MNLTLWIAAGLLAAVALLGGVTKTFVPKDRLASQHGGEWTAQASVGFAKTLGVLELLAAVGLILPAVVDVVPVMLMVGAMITHGRLGQLRFVLLNVAYLALAAFIAWGRFGPQSFAA